MKILFIRHAAAQDISDVPNSDEMLRALTREGRKAAESAFKAFVQFAEPPDVVVSSEAVRARQTADLYAKASKCRQVRVSKLLNPGFDARALHQLVSGLPRKTKVLALVGHEPDFSKVIGASIGDSSAQLDVKKASFVQVDVNDRLAGKLEILLPAKVATRLAGRRRT